MVGGRCFRCADRPPHQTSRSTSLDRTILRRSGNLTLPKRRGSRRRNFQVLPNGTFSFRAQTGGFPPSRSGLVTAVKGSRAGLPSFSRGFSLKPCRPATIASHPMSPTDDLAATCMGSRRLFLFALPAKDARCRSRQVAAGNCRRVADHQYGGGGVVRPRSHQYAGLGPGTRRHRRCGAHACRASRRIDLRRHRRRTAGAELPDDPRRRPRQPAPAAPDRYEPGVRRARRKSPSSARASRSTRAGSTSSLRAACS